tara:strand:+ start:628 stop:741 length:114 start_codon:yes stop_codon:yes gene_type:complete
MDVVMMIIPIYSIIENCEESCRVGTANTGDNMTINRP